MEWLKCERDKCKNIRDVCLLNTSERDILNCAINIIFEKFYGVSAEELFNDIKKSGLEIKTLLKLKQILRHRTCIPISITEIKVANVRYWYCDVKLCNELKKIFCVGEKIIENKFRFRLKDSLKVSHDNVEVIKKIMIRDHLAYRDYTKIVVKSTTPHSEKIKKFLENYEK